MRGPWTTALHGVAAHRVGLRELGLGEQVLAAAAHRFAVEQAADEEVAVLLQAGAEVVGRRATRRARPNVSSRRPRAAGPRLSIDGHAETVPQPGSVFGDAARAGDRRGRRGGGRAGLECIEWGADVHVPPGDLDAARHARAATEAAGLRVASYGSYWRCAGPFAPVLASARELGAPRVRIWAGEAARPRGVGAGRRGRRARGRAPDRVAFEFHGGTLTEDVDSALALIAASGVPCYWQPPQDMDDDEALDGLRRLPHVPAVHVFSWWPGATRLPLRARRSLWERVFADLPGRRRAARVRPGRRSGARGHRGGGAAACLALTSS